MMKRLVLSILSLFVSATAVFADGEITFEVAAPTVVEAGELFRIEFVVNALNAEFTPPIVEGFEVMAGPQESHGSSTSIDFNSGTSVRIETTTFTYVLQGFTAGLHTISAARVTVDGKNYSSKPVTIEVVGDAGQNGNAAGRRSTPVAGQGAGSSGSGSAREISADDIFLRAVVSRSEVYKGEPLVVTLKLFSRIQYFGLDALDKIPSFNGFWQQDISPDDANSTRQRETSNNRVYNTWILKEYLLYPQQAGSLTIEPFEATISVQYEVQDRSPRDIFDALMGGTNVETFSKKISTVPVRINVRELPGGAPDGFDGAVGEFELDATLPAPAMNANTSGTYTLRLSGTGNFPLIRAPHITLPDSFEGYNVTTSDNTRNTRGGTSGYKEFSYPFIPRADGLYTIPAFEFSFFNPKQGQYVTLSSRATSVEVAVDSTATVSVPAGRPVSGVSREDLQIFGQDIRFIKRGAANLHPKGRMLMWSPLFFILAGAMIVLFVTGYVILNRYLHNMQSDRFVRSKRANKVAIRRFRTAEASMKQGDRYGFYDEMLKALWGYMGDKLDIEMANLTKDRIREELFERGVPQADGEQYVKIISECEEAQYSPVSSTRINELYKEGIALISNLESAIKPKHTRQTKQLVVCLLSIIALSIASANASDVSTLWKEANDAYYANDFASAAALYDSIEHSGMVSAKLYYNKGNALFKMGKTGESILYYNKALRLTPADEDIAHNLDIASTYTHNRIEPVPEFFLGRWMGALRSAMNENGWAWLSLALLAVVLAGALLYLLPLGRRMRKAGFYGGLAALLLLVFAFSFASRDYREATYPTGGVVMNPSAAVKSSPDSAGKDLFVLYEGDRVTVRDVLNGWSEVTVANGNRGWIRTDAISMID